MRQSGSPVGSARMDVGQPECMLPCLHIARRIETRCQDFTNKARSGLAKWEESSSEVHVQTDVCMRCACASSAVSFRTPRNKTRPQNKGRGAGLVLKRGPCFARIAFICYVSRAGSFEERSAAPSYTDSGRTCRSNLRSLADKAPKSKSE